MNPETNKFEALEYPLSNILPSSVDEFNLSLLRPNGSPVPKHWSVFRVGEDVVIKDYTFKVAYIGESAILFEPVGVVIIKSSEI